jgi:phytoene synthase
VASAVGLACLHIWGCHDLNAAREPAIQCGYAFQLTNILRDLREDAQHDRIYLPREELRRFHVFDNDLRNGTQDRRFLELMSFEVAHARELYKTAAATNRFLHADGKRMFSMMFHTYRGLLEKIARDPAAVFARRVRLSHMQKIKVAAVSVLRGVP